MLYFIEFLLGELRMWCIPQEFLFGELRMCRILQGLLNGLLRSDVFYMFFFIGTCKYEYFCFLCVLVPVNIRIFRKFRRECGMFYKSFCSVSFHCVLLSKVCSMGSSRSDVFFGGVLDRSL